MKRAVKILTGKADGPKSRHLFELKLNGSKGKNWTVFSDERERPSSGASHLLVKVGGPL